MQTQTKRFLWFNKINIYFSSGALKLLLIPKVYPLPKVKKSFLKLSKWNNELLSTPYIITFLAKSSSKFHESFPSDAVT